MKKFIILLILTVSAISCDYEDIGNDISITGFVNLINESGIELIERNDVIVTMQGASNATRTDKNGKFLFAGLKAGNSYSFDFSKDGFGTRNGDNYKFVGNQKPGLLNTISLYQIPTIELKSSTIEYSNNVVTIIGQITDTKIYSIGAFANDSSDVSEFHYDYSSGYSALGVTFTSFMLSIYLNNNKYIPGTTLYVAIYFYNKFDNGYLDSEKNKIIRSSAKKAGVLRITL